MQYQSGQFNFWYELANLVTTGLHHAAPSFGGVIPRPCHTLLLRSALLALLVVCSQTPTALSILH